jgi:hypothetical protein
MREPRGGEGEGEVEDEEEDIPTTERLFEHRDRTPLNISDQQSERSQLLVSRVQDPILEKGGYLPRNFLSRTEKVMPLQDTLSALAQQNYRSDKASWIESPYG